MNKENKIKLRIKHPNGAEFEAEGPIEFILEQKKAFINDFIEEKNKEETKGSIGITKDNNNIWAKIINYKEDIPYIPIKDYEIKPDIACLILMSAIKNIKKEDEISAIKLSKAIKLSGFSPKRLDRELAKEIKKGTISALGTKRNRVYKINQKGIEEAYVKILSILKKQNIL